MLVGVEGAPWLVPRRAERKMLAIEAIRLKPEPEGEGEEEEACFFHWVAANDSKASGGGWWLRYLQLMEPEPEPEQKLDLGWLGSEPGSVLQQGQPDSGWTCSRGIGTLCGWEWGWV